VEKTGSKINSTRKFVWSGSEKCEFRDAADAVTQRNYSQGQYAGTTPSFYSRDHLGSIREMRNSAGTVVARYDYDPSGRSTTLISTTPTDFNFTGLYRHSASNLDLAVYRAYDPDLGRWLNRDPVGEKGGLNLYGYVENGPINGVDRLGLYVNVPLADKATYRAAWQYLINFPEMRDAFRKVYDSETRFVIDTNCNNASHYEPNWDSGGTIFWDPRTAHDYADGGVQTPALVLGHEFFHVLDSIQQGNIRYIFDSLTNGPAKELQIITGPEARFAAAKGEKVRTNHSTSPSTHLVSDPSAKR